MPCVGFEPTISAGERPKTYALDRTATGTGIFPLYSFHLLSSSYSLRFPFLLLIFFSRYYSAPPSSLVL